LFLPKSAGFNPEEALRRNPERRFGPGGQTLNVRVWVEM
jgi:hypothetical protein